MKKKRLAAWLMVLCLCTAALAGCSAKEEDKKADTAKEEQAKKDDKAKSQTPIKVGALKGPTAMGMAQMLDDDQYEFTISASPDDSPGTSGYCRGSSESGSRPVPEDAEAGERAGSQYIRHSLSGGKWE